MNHSAASHTRSFRPILRLLLRGLLCVLLGWLHVEARSATVRPFEAGDRICFLGDSITKGGSYHALLELFYALRFPGRTMEFFNCGVGGDRAKSMLGASSYRIETDVLSHRPTVITVMLGMNDVERALYAPATWERDKAARAAALETYRASVKTLVQTLQKSGAHVILLSPTIYEESPLVEKKEGLTGINAALASCARLLREISQELHTDFVDVHTVMDALNQAQQAKVPAFSITGDGQSWNDRVHPGPTGHFVIAHAVLSAQGVVPQAPALPLPGQRVPGFSASEIPAPLLALAEERRRVGEELRETATFRYAMVKEGLDPTDSAFGEWLKEKRTAIERVGRTAPWLDRALRVLEKEKELERRCESLSVEIREKAASLAVRPAGNGR
ncbi:MAG: hypothetical protein RLZZ244_1687 [Verrucomicrobiota bacterium]